MKLQLLQSHLSCAWIEPTKLNSQVVSSVLAQTPCAALM